MSGRGTICISLRCLRRLIGHRCSCRVVGGEAAHRRRGCRLLTLPPRVGHLQSSTAASTEQPAGLWGSAAEVAPEARRQ